MSNISAHGISADLRRHVARLTTEYFLTQTKLMTAVLGVDLVSMLVFLAISDANARNMTADAGICARFGGLDDVAPDSLRRGVSVYALAKDLDLPYETTRRHVNKLVEVDLCQRAADGGLFVPAKVFARPDFIATTDRHWRVTEGFVVAMLRAGVVFDA